MNSLEACFCLKTILIKLYSKKVIVKLPSRGSHLVLRSPLYSFVINRMATSGIQEKSQQHAFHVKRVGGKAREKLEILVKAMQIEQKKSFEVEVGIEKVRNWYNLIYRLINQFFIWGMYRSSVTNSTEFLIFL